jgi:hypothetical protein
VAQLVPFVFNTPGVAGLNTQAATAILGQEWCTVATDLSFDANGRLALRKGTRRDTNNTTAGDIETRFTGINVNGTYTRYCADSGGVIYERSSNAWTSRDAYTNPSDGNFKFQNFNDKVLAWHADGQELVQSAVGANFVSIVASSGTVPAGVDMLAAYGRVWVIDNDTLYYSGLLDETDWGTGGGTFELRYSWPAGQDVPVALAEFNGFLVVFGQKSLIIYERPDDPVSSMAKVEAIEGNGCVNRDTVQNIGRDILFLSRDGIKSLSRVIQEKSMPFIDAVPQGRDYIIQQYDLSTADNVTSCYSQQEGVYLLSLQQTTIAVDTRAKLPGSTYRFTEWKAVSSLAVGEDGVILTADGTASYFITGNLDEVAFDGTGGTAIEGNYESGWLDFDSAAQGVGVLEKFLKDIKMSVAGGSQATITFKWYVDYKDALSSASASIPQAPDAAQYGIAQYAIDKYGTSVEITDLNRPASKGGRVVKVGWLVNGSQSAFAINQMIVFAKTGKISV